MPIVLKSGSLKFLEPLGRVQACNGIALLLNSRKYCISVTKTNRLILFVHSSMRNAWRKCGLSPRRADFDARSIYVRFVFDKVAVGQVSVRVLRSTLSAWFHPCSIVIFTYTIPLAGQTGKARGTLQIGMFFWKSGSTGRKNTFKRLQGVKMVNFSPHRPCRLTASSRYVCRQSVRNVSRTVLLDIASSWWMLEGHVTGPHRRREEAAGGAFCVFGQPWRHSEQERLKSQKHFRAKRRL